ncbi:MAG TPA: hypothetical protein PLD47_18510 [Aggregatilineales bacterium]|nr:hypothetical protein [Anaerolineales bacterium]HRE49722.1 hypothetical protein [Aggregatilineales bacterium]
MAAVFRSFWRGLRFFEKFNGVFVPANIVAMLCALPLITAPAAYAGMCRVANAAQTTPTCHIDDYWSGFRASLGRGAIIALLTVGVFFLIIVNINTYWLQTGALFIALRLVWLTGAIFWISVLLYLFPLLERMEQPDLLAGLKNAALMTVTNPFYSLAFVGLVILVAALSTVLVVPWGLLTLAVIANAATAAVENRLRQAGVI